MLSVTDSIILDVLLPITLTSFVVFWVFLSVKTGNKIAQLRWLVFLGLSGMGWLFHYDGPLRNIFPKNEASIWWADHQNSISTGCIILVLLISLIAGVERVKLYRSQDKLCRGSSEYPDPDELFYEINDKYHNIVTRTYKKVTASHILTFAAFDLVWAASIIVLWLVAMISNLF